MTSRSPAAREAQKSRPTTKLPPPGGFQRKVGEPEGRCPYCSFMPTSRADFCDVHKPRFR
jgi:hypothetical protein